MKRELKPIVAMNRIKKIRLYIFPKKNVFYLYDNNDQRNMWPFVDQVKCFNKIIKLTKKKTCNLKRHLTFIDHDYVKCIRSLVCTVKCVLILHYSLNTK